MSGLKPQDETLSFDHVRILGDLLQRTLKASMSSLVGMYSRG